MASRKPPPFPLLEVLITHEMDDLALLTLLTRVQPSQASSFLTAILGDACGSPYSPSAVFSCFAFVVVDTHPIVPLESLARVARAIFLDALSRSATEPSFSERLIRAGVGAPEAALFSSVLFKDSAATAAAARGALTASVGGGGGSRLVEFDWAAKATLASSSLQGGGAKGAVLALTLRSEGGVGGAPMPQTPPQMTLLELSRGELAAMIDELEAVHEAMVSVAG